VVRLGNVSFDRENMYKQILLTDKELELLASIIQYYIDQKRDKPGFEINNAHIVLRHICGVDSHQNTNQITFCGK
jgi:hypothetical protein